MGRESFFLVRHGQNKRDELTPEGIHDAHRASQELLAKGLGASALILTSTSPRAILTARIIGEDLQASVLQSERIRLGGMQPSAVRNLDEWVKKALVESDPIHEHPDQPLVVVTHAQLIAIARGLEPHQEYEIGYGEVFEYLSESWINRGFNELSEIKIEGELRALR